MTRSFLHPFAKPSSTDFVQIVRAEGAVVWDSEGRELIDGFANLWNCLVGHGRTEIAEAVSKQILTVDCYNTFAPFTNEPAERLAERIAGHSPHPNGRVFFSCTGSGAVDSAIKLGRLVQHLRGHPERNKVLTRTKGYHGVNYGGTTAQGIPLNREGFGPLLPGFVRVEHHDLDAVRSAFASYPGEIGIVLTEPMQGAGGIWPPKRGYLQALRDLCDEHGALLVFDEVVTGFGRLGSWFAAQHYGVTPDLITFAKGVTSGYVPLGGVILSRACSDTLAADPDFVLRTGFTYSGHPTACAAGLANLDIIEREGLVERANHIGEVMVRHLAELQKAGRIGATRGVKAVWAIELLGGQHAFAARDRLLDLGVVVRPQSATAIGLCPPLIISDEQLGRIFEAIGQATA